MLNVNELTSQMAKMSDAQLRQYAQLHKTDPYTLALAASESKRRAQLRAAGQQQAAQQPTVADQALAQMGAPAPMPQQMQQPQLPEEQGIGMLPAQNMAGMADGGIAGYADGGMVAFADGDLVQDREAAQAEIDRAELLDTLNRMGAGTKDLLSLPVRGVAGAAESVPYITRPLRALGIPALPESFYGGDRTSMTPYYDEIRRQDAAKQKKTPQKAAATNTSSVPSGPYKDTSGVTYDNYGNPMTSSYVDSSGVVYDAYGNPKSATPKTTMPPPAPAAKDKGKRGTGPFADSPSGRKAASQQPGTATAPDFVPSKPGDLTAELKRLQSMNPGTKAYDDLSAKIKQGYADLEKAREEGKPKDKAYAGLEALLGKEEEKAKGKEARNYNMALVNAGLAIAGGKSQYALQNIAEGAQVGTKQYQEGLEKLEAAALERRKQSAMIEEARRAEARGDWKDAQQYKQKAFEAELGVNQAQIAAVQDLYKTDLKTATDIVNTQNTLASADQRALMQQREETKRHEALMRNQRAVAGINAAAYASRVDQRGAITPALLFREYNDSLQKDLYGDFKNQYPTFQHYVIANQQMASPTVVSELPQNANVRK